MESSPSQRARRTWKAEDSIRPVPPARCCNPLQSTLLHPLHISITPHTRPAIKQKYVSTNAVPQLQAPSLLKPSHSSRIPTSYPLFLIVPHSRVFHLHFHLSSPTSRPIPLTSQPQPYIAHISTFLDSTSPSNKAHTTMSAIRNLARVPRASVFATQRMGFQTSATRLAGKESKLRKAPSYT